MGERRRSLRCQEKVSGISERLCNVLHAALVCHRCYLEVCVQRFVIRLLCLPFHSTKAAYRNAKHLLLNIIPLRMFVWHLFISVCAMRWKKLFKSRTTLRLCREGGREPKAQSNTKKMFNLVFLDALRGVVFPVKWGRLSKFIRQCVWVLWSARRMLWPSGIPHALRSAGDGHFGLAVLSDLHLVAWAPSCSAEWLPGVLEQTHPAAHTHPEPQIKQSQLSWL